MVDVAGFEQLQEPTSEDKKEAKHQRFDFQARERMEKRPEDKQDPKKSIK